METRTAVPSRSRNDAPAPLPPTTETLPARVERKRPARANDELPFTD